MELILKTPIEDLVPKLIAFNNEELKNQLKPQLEKYKNVVYTEEQISEAKSDRATLNKLKNAIEDERKRVKKVYLEPYNNFENQVKEIVGLVDETSNVIDSQIRSFEDTKKQNKKLQIFEFWNENIGDLCKLVDFDKIFNEQWLNVTYSDKKWKEDITNFIIKVNQDLAVITSLKFKDEQQLKVYYFNCFDLALTLQEKTRLEDMENKLAELSQKRAVEDTLSAGNEKLSTDVETKTYDFRIVATREQVELLKEFLIKNKIQYGKVPNQN